MQSETGVAARDSEDTHLQARLAKVDVFHFGLRHLASTIELMVDWLGRLLKVYIYRVAPLDDNVGIDSTQAARYTGPVRAGYALLIRPQRSS